MRLERVLAGWNRFARRSLFEHAAGSSDCLGSNVICCNARAENRLDSRRGVTFGDLGGLDLGGVGLRRWPPEDHQLADAACEPQPGGDQQTPPAVQEVVETRRAKTRMVQA